VIKKDGRRVEFDRGKIMSGLIRACEKRPISTETLERVVSEIEQEVYSHYDKEVTSRQVGQLVMKKLRSLDQVAYVRFASVYREFKDVSEFVEEVKPMLDRDR
jgi:transcriptional repressor NrdR